MPAEYVRKEREHEMTLIVDRARNGDQTAWNEIVRRFTPLVIAIGRAHGLSNVDILDASQFVWLRLVEHLDRLREPQALAGWIAVTARHECYSLSRTARRMATPLAVDHLATSFVDEDVLDRLEREEVGRAFTRLSDRCRELLAVLVADQPLPYAQIAVALDMPIGSIGPTRARCLDQLRRLLHATDTPKERT